MSYLLDTNVLLRSIEAGHPHHATARRALERLALTPAALYVAPQNLIEFWVVATRPTTARGLGLTPAQALSEVAKFEASFTVAVDSPAVYAQWRRLVAAYGVSGLPSHDARLVAVMRVHGIANVVTFNKADFHRYAAGEGIALVDPATVPEPPTSQVKPEKA